MPIGFEAESVAMSDEHATVKTTGPLPSLGAHVDFTPGQIRTTFNLHDHVWLTRKGTVVDFWKVAARGSSQ
jgi:D-serine deaminase-like pyridoxal phosphate-dependent protein